MSTDPYTLATELQHQLQSMTKAQHLAFVAAMDAAGGEIAIDPEELAASAVAPATRIHITVYDGLLRIRTERPMIIDGQRTDAPYSTN